MEKENAKWTIKEIEDKIDSIDFPEFQREPPVWNLEKKRRLIDSIFRGFDIASMYFYKRQDNDTDKYDCIDGRQRINAIMSFLGKNKSEESNNNFVLTMTNEIYTDTKSFESINNRAFNSLSPEDQGKFRNYEINVVEMWEIEPEEELNLLFLRLNLGQILNSGEKLNAMIGEMRDYVFKEIGTHNFFSELSIPYRRYAKEQVAAQIALNYFSRTETGKFQRSRYVDLQEFFKTKSKFNDRDKELTKKISGILDIICTQLTSKLEFIRSRAIAVSVFLFISELITEGKENEIPVFVEFLITFLKTLKWQVPQAVKMHPAYYFMLEGFQAYVTNAAGEEYAIRNRHNFLLDNFNYFKEHQMMKGDTEYEQDTGKFANAARAQIKL